MRRKIISAHSNDYYRQVGERSNALWVKEPTWAYADGGRESTTRVRIYCNYWLYTLLNCSDYKYQDALIKGADSAYDSKLVKDELKKLNITWDDEVEGICNSPTLVLYAAIVLLVSERLYDIYFRTEWKKMGGDNEYTRSLEKFMAPPPPAPSVGQERYSRSRCQRCTRDKISSR